MKKLIVGIALSLSMIGSRVQAEKLNSDQEKALEGVLNLLTDPVQRNENLKKDKKAAESDDWVKKVGGEHSEEIYQLAAKVMESLVKQTQGDADAMEKILEKAKNDPESFANTFNSEQKDILKNLGKKIETGHRKSVP